MLLPPGLGLAVVVMVVVVCVSAVGVVPAALLPPGHENLRTCLPSFPAISDERPDQPPACPLLPRRCAAAAAAAATPPPSMLSA